MRHDCICYKLKSKGKPNKTVDAWVNRWMPGSCWHLYAEARTYIMNSLHQRQNCLVLLSSRIEARIARWCICRKFSKDRLCQLGVFGSCKNGNGGSPESFHIWQEWSAVLGHMRAGTDVLFSTATVMTYLQLRWESKQLRLNKVTIVLRYSTSHLPILKSVTYQWGWNSSHLILRARQVWQPYFDLLWLRRMTGLTVVMLPSAESSSRAHENLTQEFQRKLLCKSGETTFVCFNVGFLKWGESDFFLPPPSSCKILF
jgi:hypothetical protein